MCFTLDGFFSIYRLELTKYEIDRYLSLSGYLLILSKQVPVYLFVL